METSTAVLNKFGQILLGANIKIEDHHLNILKTWGIITIEVHVNESGDEQSIQNIEKLNSIKETLLANTGWLPRIPQEEDLFEMAAQQIFEKQNSETCGN